MELLLDVREEQANFFLELVQKFEFVSIKSKIDRSPYNQEFVEKILAGKDDRLEGKTTRIRLDELWK